MFRRYRKVYLGDDIEVRDKKPTSTKDEAKPEPTEKKMVKKEMKPAPAAEKSPETKAPVAEEAPVEKKAAKPKAF